VDQVNTAVAQMDKVTQQTASGAEESASAAEELSAQAQATKVLVEELVVLVRGGQGSSGSSTRTTGRLPRGATHKPAKAPEKNAPADLAALRHSVTRRMGQPEKTTGSGGGDPGAVSATTEDLGGF
jgi:hypothetical protein